MGTEVNLGDLLSAITALLAVIISRLKQSFIWFSVPIKLNTKI